MRRDLEMPADWAQLQWHVDPESKRYHSRDTAHRAVRWLNSNEHGRDRWYFRVGPIVGGRVVLERRWIGD